MTLDGIGYHGFVLHYAGVFVFFGGAVIIFLYLWYKGRLDMDEEPKYQMFEMEEKNERR